MRPHILVLFLVCFITIIEANEIRNITIRLRKRKLCHVFQKIDGLLGVSLPLSSRIFRGAIAEPARQGLEYVEEWVERNPVVIKDKNDKTLNLHFKFKVDDDGGNITTVRKLYSEYVKDKTASIFYGPFSTTNSKAAATILEENKLAGFFWIGTSFGSARRSLSIITPSENLFSVTLSSLRLAGAKNVSLVYAEEAASRCISPTFEEYLTDNAFNIVGRHAVPLTRTYSIRSGLAIEDYSATYLKNITDTADIVIEEDPDVWIFCMSVARTGNAFMNYFKEIDYTPKAFVSELPLTAEDIDGDLREFRSGIAVFEPSVDYSATTYGTMSQFTADIQERFNVTASELHLYALIVSILVKEGIEQVAKDHALEVDENGRLSIDTTKECTCANDTENVDSAGFLLFQDELYRAVFSMKLDTIAGRYSWGADQVQQREGVFVQYINGKREVIAPERLKTRDLVYPMPTWKERIFKQEYGHWSEVFVSVVAIILAFMSILLSIFLAFIYFTRIFTKRTRNLFMASSPLFLWFILLGSIILYFSVFLFMPNIVSEFTCIARVWMVDIGFILLFGPFFAKTLRVERLWRNKSTEVFSISNFKVFMWVAALLGVHFVLLIIMTIVGSYKTERIIVDELRKSLNYYQCKEDLVYKIFLYLIIGTNALLLLVGCVIAFRVRLIPIKRYNESKVIFFSIYNIFFFALIAFALSFANLERFTSFLIVALLIQAGTAFTIIALFGHKYAIQASHSQKVKRCQASTTSNGSTTNETANTTQREVVL